MADSYYKEMKEVADTFLEPNGLPEAPASATIRVWIDGYGVLLTMRSEKVKDVVNKILTVVKIAKEKGWKPTWKEEEEKKEVPRPKKQCSKCGSEMVFRSGEKNGRKWSGWFCQNKYCGNVEWERSQK